MFQLDHVIKIDSNNNYNLSNLILIMLEIA